ncbi:MAG: hypothetical protein AB7O50_09095 [Pseudolabrys sp.]
MANKPKRTRRTEPERQQSLVIWLWNKAVQEYRQQPIGFIVGLVGVPGVIYSAISSLPALTSTVNIQPLGLSVIGKVSGFVLLQGTLAAIQARIQYACARLGSGMPFILAILTAILAGWISAFISFWFVLPDQGASILLYIGATFLAWFLFLYFLGAYEDPANSWETGLAAFFLITLALISFSVYFGFQAPPKIS